MGEGCRSGSEQLGTDRDYGGTIRFLFYINLLHIG